MPGAGELAEHERAALVVAAGDVLLGHEVHPVAQRGDEHDVGDLEERGHLLARIALVQVVHRRCAEVGVRAVDPPDRRLDLGAQRLVGLDALAARGRDLDEGDLRRDEDALVEQLLVGLEPVPDALV